MHFREACKGNKTVQLPQHGQVYPDFSPETLPLQPHFCPFIGIPSIQGRTLKFSLGFDASIVMLTASGQRKEFKMHRDGAGDGVRQKGHQQVAQREPEIHDYRCVTFRSLRKARCRPVLQMAFASVLQRKCSDLDMGGAF